MNRAIVGSAAGAALIGALGCSSTPTTINGPEFRAEGDTMVIGVPDHPDYVGIVGTMRDGYGNVHSFQYRDGGSHTLDLDDAHLYGTVDVDWRWAQEWQLSDASSPPAPREQYATPGEDYHAPDAPVNQELARFLERWDTPGERKNIELMQGQYRAVAGNQAADELWMAAQNELAQHLNETRVRFAEYLGLDIMDELGRTRVAYAVGDRLRHFPDEAIVSDALMQAKQDYYLFLGTLHERDTHLDAAHSAMYADRALAFEHLDVSVIPADDLDALVIRARAHEYAGDFSAARETWELIHDETQERSQEIGTNRAFRHFEEQSTANISRLEGK